MTNPPTLIASSGISGLYCALQLADAGRQVLIVDSSADRYGKDAS